MRGTYLSDSLRIRLIVGFLGEAGQYGWWRTSFYQPSSHHFLDPIFPRTGHLAQYHGVVEAARLNHDENLSAGTYHLFRLPEEVEQDLHALMQENAGEDAIGESLRDKASALAALKSSAHTGSARTVGPTAVGNIRDLMSPKTIRQIAGVYAMAFDQGIKSYPYLVN
ncbi:MAG: BrxE family protein [Mesorhizobium sp.]|uniref:BrxE family protein n=1 Tax=Mesorhizobium sp. TaxID=1871066 RepID=UPI001226AD0A|nr:BrxE family protein [Mesorhizobium sp.]TIL20462.1 MAG: BrxE family protein [Mesorhizobium sp.]